MTAAAGNLTMFKKSVIVLIVLTALSATPLTTWPRRAWALDLGKLLDNISLTTCRASTSRVSRL